MQWVEIPKRSVFRHPVKVDRVGVTLVWNFSTMKRDIAFGVSVRNVPETDAKGLKEILPIRRYDSHKVSVKGSLKIEQVGTYVLIFDNSFSRLMSKRLTFWTDIKTEGEREAEPDLTGWMMKRKRQRGIKSAWSRRFLQMSKGVLSYYKKPGAYCRGTIDISTATVTVILRTRQIVIDSGLVLFHLRAYNDQDLQTWIDEFRKYRDIQFSKQLQDDDHPISAAAGAGDDVLHTDEIAAKLDKIRGDLDRASHILDVRRPGTAASLKDTLRRGLRRPSASHIAVAHEDGGAASPRPASTAVAAPPAAPQDPRAVTAPPQSAATDPQLVAILKDALDDLQSCFVDLVVHDTARKHAVEVEIARRKALEAEVAELRTLVARSGAVPPLAVPAPDGAAVLSPRGSVRSRGPVAGVASDDAVNQLRPRAPSWHSVSASTRSKQSFYDAAEVIVDASEAGSSDDEHDEADVAEASDDSDDDDTRSGTLPHSLPSTDADLGSGEMLSVARTCLPANAPETDLNLFGLLRRYVGKDLSKVSMPVSLNEPLSMLQRICEELEYANLLDHASGLHDPLQRLMYVAAFAVSGYASTANRPSRKPFNPLLGETFEYLGNGGLKFVAEKVCHHPTIVAAHCESPNFVFHQDQQPSTKFWGKSIELTSSGTIHVELPKTGDHFTWHKVTTCMRNIFSDARKLEHYGDMTIRNLTTGDYCVLTFKESGFFSTSNNDVVGTIYNKTGRVLHHLTGRWDQSMQQELNDEQFLYLWRANALPPTSSLQYGFTQFAIELNELTDAMRSTLPPTDSRFRPDQRLLEEGHVEEAEAEKTRIEEKQRAARKSDADAWKPQWFELRDNEYRYKGGYWQAKAAKAFPIVDLF